MPRLIKKTHKGPIKVGDKHICMCGLSKKEPFCDKTHLAVATEADDKLYWYGSGEREEIATEEVHKHSEDHGSGCCGNCHNHEQGE